MKVFKLSINEFQSAERVLVRVGLVGVTLVLLSCAGARPPTTSPVTAASEPAKRTVGLASWYGQRHHGRPTASGETFDMNQLTAAHRTLPFGTRLRVTNLDNGRSVVVRVNDRGPHVPGRILDLSLRAAQAIGMAANGVVRVEMVVLARGK